MDEVKTEKRRGHWIAPFGLALSVAYLGFWGWILFPIKWQRLRDMDLNAIGDFLAGGFAPLAFLWLVLGFFQQRVELAQNTKALELQVKELSQAAEHAGALVEVARSELQLRLEEMQEEKRSKGVRAQVMERRRAEIHKRSLQPRFDFDNNYEQQGRSVRLVMMNRGHNCADVEVSIPENDVVHLQREFTMDLLRSESGLKLEFAVLNRNGTAPMKVTYVDLEGDQHEAEFIVSLLAGQLTVTKSPA
jgi:hypothetical protein